MGEVKPMKQRKAARRIISILAICLFFCIFFMGVLTSSAADGQRSMPSAGRAIVGVQETPTADATTTALSKQKLESEVHQLQQQNDRSFGAWLWGSGATLLSTAVALGAGLAGFLKWRSDQRTEQEKRKDERDAERAKREEEWRVELTRRAEERFQSVVEGLGSKDTERQVGAAITLRTFLQPGYEDFYRQTFDLAVAHLRMREAEPERPASPSFSSSDQGLIVPSPMLVPQNQKRDDSEPLPLDSLSQALILVFQEAFPLARDWEKEQVKRASKGFDPHILDASAVRLDHAHFSQQADFASAWLVQASFQKAHLRLADLRDAAIGGADLRGADLCAADLRRAYIREADLRGADLRMANLGAVKLSGTDLLGARLNGAELSGANLSGADLCAADLSGANLSGANLSWANLHLAYLRKADLTNARPELAGFLDQAQMGGVIGLSAEQRQACIEKGAIFDDEGNA